MEQSPACESHGQENTGRHRKQHSPATPVLRFLKLLEIGVARADSRV
jgi:hypothetical protein